MKKTALITGVTGQDGAYLSQLLLEQGYRVVGGERRTSTPNRGRLEALGVANELEYVALDLSDLGNMIRVLELVEPDEVYNLAAQSFVAVSFEQPLMTTDVTGVGALRMLEGIRLVDPSIRFYQASTSEMFGRAQEVPQRETTMFHPRSPYGVAKLYAHWATVNYREAYGMFTASGILFNHESPLRGPEFVTRKITMGAAAVHLGRASELRLGNLDAARDWGFAGDYVKGMHLMLQQEEPDDFVLATGDMHTVRDFASAAFAALDLDWEQFVVTDPAFERPAEVDELRGDASKARRQLGWEPRMTFEELVATMVREDVERMSGKPHF